MCDGIDDLPERVRKKKNALEDLRAAIPSGSLDDLEHHHRIDITYTSSALEGNALTAGEMAFVLEKGIAVGGKSIEHHLEIVNHARALELISEFAAEDKKAEKIRRISEPTVRVINYSVLFRGRFESCSTYAKQAPDGSFESEVDRPPPSMVDFCGWLKNQPDTPETAFAAHHRLSDIRPFVAGNEVTARLLMNYILLRAGYPPIAVRSEDRPAYLAALAAGDGRGAAFTAMMFRYLNQTLDLYLSAANQALAVANQQTEREL